MERFKGGLLAVQSLEHLSNAGSRSKYGGALENESRYSGAKSTTHSAAQRIIVRTLRGDKVEKKASDLQNIPSNRTFADNGNL
jgi:hypothetical protein